MTKISKRILIVVLLLIISFSIGVLVYNENKSNKTIPKRAKFVYEHIIFDYASEVINYK